MNVSYRWLREIAPGIQASPEALADRLGMLGAPVEEMGRPGAGLEDIVVARVVNVREHPNADKLRLCDVDAGDGDPVQVVCGAPVIEEGGLYPLAPLGTTLPGGLEIEEAEIRGETSRGMLCSEAELALGKDASGILRLADGLTVGAPLVDELGLDDTRLTLEITPNRPDLLSHVGVARELAPDGHHGIELPPFPARDSEERTDAAMPAVELRRFDAEGTAEGVRIAIDDAEGCPRYIGVIIEGVEVGPSPTWLGSRLRAIGLRPINNVVDATNYILHELGQPLHAFDLDRLEGPAIVVRRARAGETITTLDDVERSLEPDTLVIADAEDPVAVAGVMGGAESEVSRETTRVLVECAYFDPRTVRRTARALGLSTDASYRFERGTDIDGMERAARRAVELIQALAGGQVAEAGVDVYPSPEPPPVVAVRPSRVPQVLGEAIDTDTIEELLTHLGFELHERTDDALSFLVPGFRTHDVTREIDLIEEVARRYGYDRFEETRRPHRPTAVPEAPLSALEDRLRDFCVGGGLLETRSIPMAPEGAGTVELLRPLSAEESMLRSTLAHGLLRAAEVNLARGVRDIRLFELGTTFHDSGEPVPDEETRVAVLLSGRTRPVHWSDEAPDYDLWDLKGLAAELAGVLGGGEVEPLGDADPGTLVLRDTLVPETALAVRRRGELVGVAGRVRDDALDAPAWAAPAFILEARLTEAMTRGERPVLTPLPTQPATDRDLALLVPRSLPAAAVAGTIRDAGGDLLETVDVFDVYTGG
ncbi:MAG: phenylalanine--tRNA ligase subunit beta, partial [Longimicrobiales bacterium]|nr:phenylalanine--tRNA ligase subunit beta [Longimicrobiales bacterium]